MAAILCALVSNHIKPGDIFAQYNGNSRLGNRSITFERAMALPEQGTPVSFEQVKALQLPLNKVYILTGPHTASAAEMVVNNLKPYITVIQVGGTTLGKDEGMITITDTRTPKRIPWVLMPITYKLLNASGAGGYHQGLTPAYPVDELASLPLQPPGNTNDPLLAKALQLIGAPGGRIAHTEQNASRQHITPGAMAYPVMVPHP